ncbi:Multidrug resistance protein 1A [Smittium mucronatum]|uniref:Multidrug resistance protein 1A n=1 Tax=Smittium mucronatum TaxID=133383 RepID=A0A1R0H1K3_9FUNG|nr:Multidrug resistance protein 1A [Smittium mucronatum]
MKLKRLKPSKASIDFQSAPSLRSKDGDSLSLSPKSFDKASRKRTAIENPISIPKKSVQSVSLLQLFRFTTYNERLILAIGTLSAILTGAALPSVIVLFSNLSADFIKYSKEADSNPQLASNELKSSVKYNCLFIVGISAAVLISAYVQNVSFSIVSERNSLRIRELYYTSVLKQNMAWFDKTSTGDLTTRISSDVVLIQDGTGPKLSLFLQLSTTFVSSFVIGFIKGWKMALVVMSIIPLLVFIGLFISSSVGRKTKVALDYRSKSGLVANEALSSMRTVLAFNGQKRESDRYDTSNDLAAKAELSKSFSLALGLGGIYFCTYAIYSLGFWYGAKLIRMGQLDPASVLNVFFAFVISGSSIGHATPSISAITSAKGAATNVFNVIDRASPIDPIEMDSGVKVDYFKGEIEFDNVSFGYPTRPDAKALDGFSIKIKPGQKVALVGHSGCGKSTTIGLIQRFYDVDSGSVKIDGVDIRQYNVRSLRQNIGIVSQEPVLFDTTILKNIQYGAKDYEKSPPTFEQIVQACKEANIHDFIMSLPLKYDTVVGERGAQLSGGQKQRIAIARSLIRNPQILLLDEATSALDTESERLVQDALDRSSKSRTTITVAHRLSTIKDSDVIYVCDKGCVVEYGTHEELVGRNGAYSALVNAQTINSESYEPLETEYKANDLEKVHKEKFLSIDLSKTIKEPKLELEDTVMVSNKTGISSLIKIFTCDRKNMIPFIPGLLGSAIDGSIFPLLAIFYAKMLASFSETDLAQQKKDTDLYSLIFLILGIVVFFSVFCRTYFCSLGSLKVTEKLRSDFYKSIIFQDSQFFDRTENGTGSLTARLASEPEEIYKFGSESFPMVFNSLCSMIVGISLSFSRDWRLTLIMLAIFPMNVYSEGQLQKSMSGRVKKSKMVTEASAKEAAETVSNIRTVAALTRELMFIENFCKNNSKHYKFAIKSCFYGGISFAFSQCSMFLFYAMAFYFGSLFVINGTLSIESMFGSIEAIVFATIALGQSSQHLSLAPKALVSSVKLVESLSTKPKIDIKNPDGGSITNTKGKISYLNAEFSYPSRIDVKILKGVSLNVKPGTTVGLVGSSGSGKSTIINLALRLYDVLDGSVKLEDVDVKDWNLHSLRNEPALVSQEPSLFDVSVAENIRYGKPDATQQEIEMATKAANIHKVIINLPDGYNTRVGANGGQLSGGQKQRMAIARALVRNPKILLLDEATSALDTESERLVQGALDEASIGRTTISIAHRLSTIQNADWIYVFDKGEIIEQGTHSHLLGLQGTYYNLVAQQSLNIL